ncbi:hypothetical protein ACHAPT_009236 [Fusarium lateritium]
MAQIIRDTFGSSLVTEPLSDPSQPLPSPSQLRGRILIKTKVAKGVDLSREPRLSIEDFPSPRQSQDYGSLTEAESTDSVPSTSPTAFSHETFTQASQSEPSLNGPLEELAVYGPGKRLPRPNKLDLTGNYIYSVSEASFKSYLKQTQTLTENPLCFLNTQHMLRVYPDASRIDSSNLSPLLYWKHGVQMVALNYQTSDLNMGLNQAMFDGSTDSSGYVLKPERLRQLPGLVSNQVKEIRFAIDVVMTKDICWPVSTLDNASAYVQIKLRVPDDWSQTKDRTRSIPVQNHDTIIDQQIDFLIKTQYPSLVFLQWSVKLSSDIQGYSRPSVMASGIAKLDNLKQGYRLLPLRKSFQDDQGCGYLLCKLGRFGDRNGQGREIGE